MLQNRVLIVKDRTEIQPYQKVPHARHSASAKKKPENLNIFTPTISALTSLVRHYQIRRITSLQIADMSRSVADATRFTATSPHAYSKPTCVRSAPASSMSETPTPNSSSKTSPRQETPQEKVARLRAERFAARASSLSRWDRLVLRGRVWADRAHKITALSLIGFSSKALHRYSPYKRIECPCHTT